MADGGEQYGVVSMARAIELSNELGLDLVEISPNAKPPVVKLIDYGKYRYQLQKKANEARKKQATISVKEIKLRPNIEKHDLEVKLKKVQQFIDQGDKIKMLMQFRGREMAHFQLGFTKFKSILEMVLEFGAVVESAPRPMGNRIIAMIAPVRKK